MQYSHIRSKSSEAACNSSDKPVRQAATPTLTEPISHWARTLPAKKINKSKRKTYFTYIIFGLIKVPNNMYGSLNGCFMDYLLQKCYKEITLVSASFNCLFGKALLGTNVEIAKKQRRNAMMAFETHIFA